MIYVFWIIGSLMFVGFGSGIGRWYLFPYLVSRNQVANYPHIFELEHLTEPWPGAAKEWHADPIKGADDKEYWCQPCHPSSKELLFGPARNSTCVTCNAFLYPGDILTMEWPQGVPIHADIISATSTYEFPSIKFVWTEKAGTKYYLIKFVDSTAFEAALASFKQQQDTNEITVEESFLPVATYGQVSINEITDRWHDKMTGWNDDTNCVKGLPW